MSRYPFIFGDVEIQNAEDLACLGMRLVPDPNDPFEGLMSELRDRSLPKQASIIAQRKRRQRVAKALAVVRAAKKAGLSVKGATIEGVTLEFREPDAAEKAILTPLEAWKAKHARSA